MGRIIGLQVKKPVEKPKAEKPKETKEIKKDK